MTARNPSTEVAAIRATRLYVAAFALVTAIIALNPPGGIVSLTALSGSLYAACFFPAILLGLYWKRGSGTAVVASYAAGLGTLSVWHLLPWGGAVHRVFPALAASIAIYVVVALVSTVKVPPEIEEYF